MSLYDSYWEASQENRDLKDQLQELERKVERYEDPEFRWMPLLSCIFPLVALAAVSHFYRDPGWLLLLFSLTAGLFPMSLLLSRDRELEDMALGVGLLVIPAAFSLCALLLIPGGSVFYTLGLCLEGTVFVFILACIGAQIFYLVHFLLRMLCIFTVGIYVEVYRTHPVRAFLVVSLIAFVLTAAAALSMLPGGPRFG